MGKSVADVAREMNSLFAQRKEYPAVLPFDTMRGPEIHRAVLSLVREQDLQGLTLDVGTGIGGVVSFWPHHRIVGVEIAEEAVKRARLSYPDVQYVVSAIEDFVWDGPPFSVAVAQESIEHWVDVPKALAGIRRLLPAGAGFIVSSPNRDSMHCRLSRKLKREAPYCSADHIHEFGFRELIECVCGFGFSHKASAGACFTPVWSMEWSVGEEIRGLTDSDEEVNIWMNDIGARCPEYAFIQAHRFEAV